MKPVRIIDAPEEIGKHILRRKCRQAREKGRPVRLIRRFRREGWKGTLPLYVLWCAECGIFTVGHPAGLGRISCKGRGCRYRERIWTPARLREKVWYPLFHTLPRKLIMPTAVLLLLMIALRC